MELNQILEKSKYVEIAEDGDNLGSWFVYPEGDTTNEFGPFQRLEAISFTRKNFPRASFQMFQGK